MPQAHTHGDSIADRPTQILNAAIACFGKRGFHQTSMHDISAEAEISVGLIYRYFPSKEAVIAALADRHKRQVHALVEEARTAPTLLEAMEILFTAHCCDNPKVISAFVVDLYAEAARNTQIANLVRGMLETLIAGVTDLIAHSPEGQHVTHALKPREMAELVFAVARGMLMRDIVQPTKMTAAERRAAQLKVTRRLWRLLFQTEGKEAYA